MHSAAATERRSTDMRHCISRLESAEEGLAQTDTLNGPLAKEVQQQTPFQSPTWDFSEVIMKATSGSYTMCYCSVSSNEQCCEARQMEGMSELITLCRVSLLSVMTHLCTLVLGRLADGCFLLVSWQRRWGLSFARSVSRRS